MRKRREQDFAARLGHPVMTDDGIEVDGFWFTRFANRAGLRRGRVVSPSSIYVGWCGSKLCAKRIDEHGRLVPVRKTTRKARRR